MPLENQSQHDDTNPGDDVQEEIVHDAGVVSSRLDQLEQRQALLDIVSDPDVRAVIEAKKNGRALKISPIDPNAEINEPESDDNLLTKDLPDDDPAKETLSKIERAFKAKIDSVTAPLLEKIKSLESVAQQVQVRDVQDQVKAAQAKYKDLSQYQKKMIEISKDNPSLSVEDLYVLAKSRSGKLRQAEEKTFSEKPTSQPRREATVKKKVERPQGRRGFNEILSEQLGKLDLTEVSEE